MSDTGFISTLHSIFGGAAATLIGAFAGRLMWHSAEVRRGHRRFLSKELLWEIPIAVGMALIGEGRGRLYRPGPARRDRLCCPARLSRPARHRRAARHLDRAPEMKRSGQPLKQLDQRRDHDHCRYHH